MFLISPYKAQLKLAAFIRERRLLKELTQEGLADRSGVPLSTLRKFEQKGVISLESFLKLLMVLGSLEDVLEVIEPPKVTFKFIDDVLKEDTKTSRKRGRKRRESQLERLK
ncbi:MAG: helix-turn-helix domain-containing protein [Myroides odoratus]|jgi:transcriptional regulator with XRE-family HTH domain|nr:helix-turn-helix domain-containing protein [Myroides odoratus]